MYTQCDQCKAIFRVNMREVTIAKGKLRCGECNSVFNATKSLSTTIPASFEELSAEEENSVISTSKATQPQFSKRTLETRPNRLPIVEDSEKESTLKAKSSDPEKRKMTINWLLIAALFLGALLIGQIAYNKRYFLLGTPLHEPEKIQMLNHNIFAHPNEMGVLLISAQIQNTAEKAQPYPVLELSLKDSQSKLVAFRRFLPKEYLTDYSDDQLIPPSIPITLKLKIKDPGSNATHFQFEFL